MILKKILDFIQRAFILIFGASEALLLFSALFSIPDDIAMGIDVKIDMQIYLSIFGFFMISGMAIMRITEKKEVNLFKVGLMKIVPIGIAAVLSKICTGFISVIIAYVLMLVIMVGLYFVIQNYMKDRL